MYSLTALIESHNIFWTFVRFLRLVEFRRVKEKKKQMFGAFQRNVGTSKQNLVLIGTQRGEKFSMNRRMFNWPFW